MYTYSYKKTKWTSDIKMSADAIVHDLELYNVAHVKNRDANRLFSRQNNPYKHIIIPVKSDEGTMFVVRPGWKVKKGPRNSIKIIKV